MVTFFLLIACSEYNLPGKNNNPGGVDDSGGSIIDDTGLNGSACDNLDAPSVSCGVSDACDFAIGGFEPIVEWEIPGVSDALPTVADLDGDGMPEVIANIQTNIFAGAGEIQVWRGDGSGMVWSDASKKIGYGSHAAVADVDHDGFPEIFFPIKYVDSLFTAGDYTVGMWSWDGDFLAESEHFTERELDYATGILVSDMDHDGSPEIIAGRAILNADLTTRGVGRYGRGAGMGTGGQGIQEGAHPAVVDLDLDGQEEVIVGDAQYDADGNPIFKDAFVGDGSPSIGNFDSDPEGEYVVSFGNTVRLHDTDGSLIWGPTTVPSANILSSPAVGDLDGDGLPETVVAGGNLLWVLRADGSLLWEARVHDESGATGASIFDFDADGVPEVVYIDETQMFAFNGSDGQIKFHSSEHGSRTMYDYPVIADVDNDGHAEILVAHDGWSSGVSIYGDVTNSWAPARKLWNQHGYSITNINDDLSVPQTAVPNFTLYNNYHSALALEPGATLGDDLQAEIVSVCEADCGAGWLRAVVRVLNKSNRELPAGVFLTLYARTADGDVKVGTLMTEAVIPSGMTSEGMVFSLPTSLAKDSEGLLLKVDDDGTGTGLISECVETDNEFWTDGPFCQN